MPRIKLKPNSPEYHHDDDKPKKDHVCEALGCHEAGDYRAPKGRYSDEYYYFCLDHVREYNKSWNYFDGMTNAQVQEEMLKSLYGDRPTWQNNKISPEEMLKQKARAFYSGGDESAQSRAQQEEEKRRRNAFAMHRDTPEYKAMDVLGLEPPLSMDTLKKRYKELAKEYHPDTNRDNPDAEELLKEVNIAYTILKDACTQYEKLMEE